MFEALKKAFGSFSEKIAYKELSEKDLEKALFELELSLISADVAPSAAHYISDSIKSRLVGQKVKRFTNIKGTVFSILREELNRIINVPPINMLDRVMDQRKKNLNSNSWTPFVIVFLGPNGCGKTTTIAKLAYLFKKEGLKVILVAADTFRAGAIEQLEKHAKKIKVRVIKREYGADPASVGVDAISHAVARKVDLVLIDTAGRLGTASDLIEEMKKIVRITRPHLRCLVVDALMGNELVNQAKIFSEHVGIDCSILTKVDADVKGGAAISLIYATKRPIEFIGVGQSYEDLKKFDPSWFIEKILGSRA